MIRKRDTVRSTKELNSLLTNMEVLDGNILLRSDEYLQLGCDLRDLKTLGEAIASAIDMENCLVLFTAEVSITYMNVDAADALIEWAGKLPDGNTLNTPQ
jgi:tRNA wybutosine-synthesizing protein 4